MMNSAMLACAGAFTFSGAVMCVLAVPLMRRRIKPNGLYGLRVPATFADEWVWYEANARSGRDLLLLGIAAVAMALLLPFVPDVSFITYALVNAALLAIGTIGFAIAGWLRANRLLKLRRAAQPVKTGSKFAPG